MRRLRCGNDVCIEEGISLTVIKNKKDIQSPLGVFSGRTTSFSLSLISDSGYSIHVMYAGKSYSATLSVLPVQPVTKPVPISLKNSVAVLIRLLMSVMDVRKPSIIVPLLISTVTMLSLQTANTRNVCLRPGLA